tara:strand:- start:332 stop:781 length:450 start_codon:yes stop_codon:yes gene_type:complete
MSCTKEMSSTEEITITPSYYSPKYNNNTKAYEDKYIFDFSHGIICPCTGSTYSKRQSFNSHCKTNIHAKWIQSMNTNATNYYERTLELEKTVKTQQILLTQSQNELEQQKSIVRYLQNTVNEYIRNNNNSTNSTHFAADVMNLNLLDFD